MRGRPRRRASLSRATGPVQLGRSVHAPRGDCTGAGRGGLTSYLTGPISSFLVSNAKAARAPPSTVASANPKVTGGVEKLVYISHDTVLLPACSAPPGRSAATCEVGRWKRRLSPAAIDKTDRLETAAASLSPSADIARRKSPSLRCVEGLWRLCAESASPFRSRMPAGMLGCTNAAAHCADSARHARLRECGILNQRGRGTIDPPAVKRRFGLLGCPVMGTPIKFHDGVANLSGKPTQRRRAPSVSHWVLLDRVKQNAAGFGRPPPPRSLPWLEPLVEEPFTGRKRCFVLALVACRRRAKEHAAPPIPRGRLSS
jgi:hypothetical protein